MTMLVKEGGECVLITRERYIELYRAKEALDAIYKRGLSSVGIVQAMEADESEAIRALAASIARRSQQGGDPK